LKPFLSLPGLSLFFTVLSSAFTAQTPGSSPEPLRLVQTYQLPENVKGNFDHFEVDLKRSRLFATPEDFKSVLVFDIATGKLIHQIDGILRPHAVLYRADADRLYVSDEAMDR
jgi:hypothetical protein